MDDSAPQGSRFRPLRGSVGRLGNGLLGTITVCGFLWGLEIPDYLGLAWHLEQFLGLFWALVLVSTFLLVPAGSRAPGDRVPWYDWVLSALALVPGLYIMVDYDRLLFESALTTADKWLVGALSIALLVEATRRMLGKALLSILVGFLIYGAFAERFPGILRGTAMSFERLSIYLYIDTDALFGIPLQVAGTIVLAFVLLGNVLFATGGATFFTGLAMSSMGRYRGGPAKISVVASSLFGMISGTAVSNVVTTGMITIPMMIANGYRREDAGAVEAVASTGGQIMPPIMGATAFIMAEFLQISYGVIIIAALLPAILYYVLVFVQIDLEAAKHGLRGLPATELPKLGAVLKDGWIFTIPLVVLIYTLFVMGFHASKAGMASIISVFLVLAVFRTRRLRLGTLGRIFVDTGRGLLEIGAICGIAGVVIGVLNASGLGFNISDLLLRLGGQSVPLLLLLAAFLCVLLGMGMPTISVYLLLAVLIAPGLVKLGLEPLSVHMFILYFGMLSMISPPVAIAAFTAASIAGADPFRTAWSSVRLGGMAFVVPFIFIYSPELLMLGEAEDIVWSFASTALGAVFLGAGLAGYFSRPLGRLVRIALLAFALAAFVPHHYGGDLGYALNAVGVLAGLAIFGIEHALARARRPGRRWPETGPGEEP